MMTHTEADELFEGIYDFLHENGGDELLGDVMTLSNEMTDLLNFKGDIQQVATRLTRDLDEFKRVVYGVDEDGYALDEFDLSNGG